jgi:hypothetical protein
MLPYADKIVTFTDPMHVLGNVIGDSLLILRPGNQIKEIGALVLPYWNTSKRPMEDFTKVIIISSQL